MDQPRGYVAAGSGVAPQIGVTDIGHQVDRPDAPSASDLFLADEENFYVELIRKSYRAWKYVNSDRTELDIRNALDALDL